MKAYRLFVGGISGYISYAGKVGNVRMEYTEFTY